MSKTKKKDAPQQRFEGFTHSREEYKHVLVECEPKDMKTVTKTLGSPSVKTSPYRNGSIVVAFIYSFADVNEAEALFNRAMPSQQVISIMPLTDEMLESYIQGNGAPQAVN